MNLYLRMISLGIAALLFIWPFNKFGLAQETEVIAGGELEYQSHCAICHGVDGKGRASWPSFRCVIKSVFTSRP